MTQSIPSSGSLTVASSSSQVATLGFTGVPAGITLTATSSTTAPSGAPTISSFKRTAESITGAVPFFYVTFSVSSNLSSQVVLNETVTLTTSNPVTATYGAAFDDISPGAGTELGAAGPGTILNGLLTILNGTSTNAPTFLAGHTYLIQFFYVPAGTASPTPSPTPSPGGSSSPSPSPSPSGSASPTPVPNFTFTNPGADSIPCAFLACNTPPLVVTDGGFTFQPTILPPSASTTVTANIATGLSQISPSASFPVFTGTGTVEFYFQLSATPTVTFASGTPAFQVSGLTGAHNCIFYGYITGNSGNAWTQISPNTGSGVAVSGGSVPLPSTSTFGAITLSPTPFYGAIVCT